MRRLSKNHPVTSSAVHEAVGQCMNYLQSADDQFAGGCCVAEGSMLRFSAVRRVAERCPGRSRGSTR